MIVGCVDWAAAERALAGQHDSGDQFLIRRREDGVLVAAIDGLGHGVEAARAARLAAAVLDAHADQTLITLMNRCHTALCGTRGVTMSLARFVARDSVVVWLGVGNVEGVVVFSHNRAKSAELLLQGGVVGGHLPPLVASTVSVAPDDTLVFATDGVAPAFADSIIRTDSPQVIADRTLRQHAKPTDDALVVVARYVKPAVES